MKGSMMGGAVSGTGLIVLLVLTVAGTAVFLVLTPTQTKTITFSFDAATDTYFANANLPLFIKGVRLYVQFEITAVPKVRLAITSEDGSPLRLIQGDLKLDAHLLADVSGWFQGLSGKKVNIAMSFEPSLETVTLPYLEVDYASF